jgi:ABC-type Fe3+/spermidine/putrescine transport system ATPase subunit
MRHLPEADAAERVANALDLVNLNGFEKREVTALSGGEQQRVALARALAIRPRLLMFDEPLGALDRGLREALLKELRSILQQTGIPAIYVTHDQEEAFAIADRVLILHDGSIVRAGLPAEVWSHPGSAFVAGFLGLGNIIRAEIRGKSKNGEWQAESDVGPFDVSCGHKHRRGDEIHLLARPLPAGEARVARSQPRGERSRNAVNTLRGVVTDVVFRQDRFRVTLDNGLYVYLPEAPKMGERIEVQVKVECLA